MVNHQDDLEMSLGITINRENAVVGHPFDHEHFGKPFDDRSPLDAIDYIRRVLTGQLKVARDPLEAGLHIRASKRRLATGRATESPAGLLIAP